MNALRLMCYFALLMVLIPWRAQAADADDFVAANRSQQAQLLEQWAAAALSVTLSLTRRCVASAPAARLRRRLVRRTGFVGPTGAGTAPSASRLSPCLLHA